MVNNLALINLDSSKVRHDYGDLRKEGQRIFGFNPWILVAEGSENQNSTKLVKRKTSVVQRLHMT